MTDQQSFLNKARKDKFILVVSPPRALLPIAQEIGINDLQISLFSSPIPAVSIPPVDVAWKGQQLKVTSQSRTAYPPLVVNFTIDNDFKNYWFLWKWLDIQNTVINSGMDPYFNAYSEIGSSSIIGNQSSKASINKDTVQQVTSTEVINKRNNQSVYPDYQVDLTVYGLDEYNNKKIRFTYTSAFITDLGEITYNYRDSEEAECIATFAYSQLHSTLISEC